LIRSQIIENETKKIVYWENWYIPIGCIWVHRTSQGNVYSHGDQGLSHVSRTHTHQSESKACQNKSAMCTYGQKPFK
jgi:hypothetical protein